MARLPGILQARLRIGAVNDPLEHEADRVADQVMRMPAPEGAVSSAPQQVSRECAECAEEEEKLQMKEAGPQAATVDAPASVHEVLRAPGQPLDAATRGFMEPRFGQDFSGVRVHTGAAAGQSARDVNANAYTVGQNMVFGAGQLAPGTHEGQQLLAHELTHVVQQAGSGPTGARSASRALPFAPLVQRQPAPGIQRLACNLEPVAKACADAASTCLEAKDYCATKYPNSKDIDKLHADAVTSANGYKSKFPNAADNLLHFLDGSGTEKVMKIDIFRDHPVTQPKYAEHLAKFMAGAKKRFLHGELSIAGPPVPLVWTDTATAFTSPSPSDFNDLGIAVGGYTLCSKASASARDPKKLLQMGPW